MKTQKTIVKRKYQRAAISGLRRTTHQQKIDAARTRRNDHYRQGDPCATDNIAVRRISMADALDQEWDNLRPAMEYLADR